MQLLDDALFDLWRKGLCEERDVVMRAIQPGELKARIANAKKGVFDEEEEGDDVDGDDDEWEEEDDQ
jgi:twitching motility protein PilT